MVWYYKFNCIFLKVGILHAYGQIIIQMKGCTFNVFDKLQAKVTEDLFIPQAQGRQARGKEDLF